MIVDNLNLLKVSTLETLTGYSARNKKKPWQDILLETKRNLDRTSARNKKSFSWSSYSGPAGTGLSSS